MGEVKSQKSLFISKILHLSAFFHCSRFYEQTLPLTRSARWSPDRDAGSRRYLDTVTPAASLSTSQDYQASFVSPHYSPDSKNLPMLSYRIICMRNLGLSGITTSSNEKFLRTQCVPHIVPVYPIELSQLPCQELDRSRECMKGIQSMRTFLRRSLSLNST